MTDDGSITRWIADLEFGSVDNAQQQLWRRYFHRLVSLARLKLGETPRGAADEEDVAARALTSFFNGMTGGRFPELHDREDLWPLLAKITSHKAIDQQRFLLAEKRGGGHRQLHLADNSSTGTGDGMVELVDTQLQPDDLVRMCEQCDRLMALLTDDELRTIAQRRLEGYKNSDIAQELGVMERTIERRLQLIRGLWAAELNAAGKSH